MAHDPQILQLFISLQHQMQQQTAQHQQQLQQLQSTLQITQQQMQRNYQNGSPAPPRGPQNGLGQLPNKLSQKLTTPPPNKAVLLMLDTTLIDLPPFPYEQLELSQSANVTRTKEHTAKLRELYREYNTLSLTIKKDEFNTPPHMRQPFHIQILKEQRVQLHATYTQIEVTRSTIEEIIAVQTACKPTLPVPYPYDDNPYFRIEELAEYLKNMQTPEPGTEHEMIWKKTARFANHRRISHAQFLFGLSSYLTGDAYEFLEDISPTKPLEQIAIDFANRFVTSNHLADAQTQLENFQRKANESIRVVKMRLEALIRKSLILYPKDQQPGMLSTKLNENLKQVVHSKTLQLIKKKEALFRKEGLTLPINDLVDLIDDAERQHGIPKSAVSIPISLHNTEVITETEDPVLDAAAQVHNLWTSLQENDEDVTELNAAHTKNVSFKNSQDALNNLRKTADSMKTYKSQKKLSNSFQKSDWSTATKVPPPRSPTPGPNATTTPMDTSDYSSSRQSRSRDPAPNANARSDSERRRQEYRKRSSTYDAYLRARSKSPDANSRHRAMTPTSFLYDKETKAIKDENERLKQQLTQSRARSNSRPRDQNASGNDYRPRSQSRNRYSNSYGNNHNNGSYNNHKSYGNNYNRGKSPHNANPPVIHAHDGATINMQLCSRCGITGAHTPQMCNTIYAVRTSDPTSEN